MSTHFLLNMAYNYWKEWSYGEKRHGRLIAGFMVTALHLMFDMAPVIC